MPLYPAPTTGGSSITSQDEGVTLTTATTSVNYVGAGVTATSSTGAVTVTIPGGGGASKPVIDLNVNNFMQSSSTPLVTFTNNYRYVQWGGDLFIGAILPTTYGGNGLTLTITYYQSGDGDTAHTINHTAAISRVQSGTTNATTSGFATAQSMTSRTIANAPSNILVTDTIVFTSGANMNSLVAGESFVLKITKGGSVTGTVYLHSANIRET